MTRVLEHIPGHTWHGRKGAVENAFKYSIDYVLLDLEDEGPLPALFSRNRRNLAAVYDADHGGQRGEGRGLSWVNQVLQAYGLQFQRGKTLLLTQPRMFGYVFNPVSFWLCYDVENELRVVIAEVSNTYGDRHSYLCHTDNLSPITAETEMHATKIFYVSPFQKIEGDYTFRFNITDERIGIWIDYSGGKGGLIATLCGKRQQLTSKGLAFAALRRPLGARRVMALIHWQALKLWWKGARFRTRPTPPPEEVSR
ncbi:cyclopropane-fatty-acyl-phospholipid synthase [Thalassobacter stenotrophicus]|uniref:DUF1365 domain-containing protein n=1 Tax=Thalassobacter TaxID=266808 RepID=UPI00051D39FD|nr:MULTISPECIES: DUF1365 domain-containing protein [Thalassobacter]KGK79551.1 cyclopropane-fatty-acyl-phospholipid synthase [Thalassobacter stenotrophicus]KGL01507.1 cyclopropane-fatty-acyl-phospholipid synthase [Thalassobacter sp. 16PALIMAR09]